MYPIIKYKENSNELVIDIIPNFRPIITFVYFLHIIIGAVFACMFIFLSFWNLYDGEIFLSLIFILGSIALIYFSNIYLKRIYTFERIIVSVPNLQIQTKEPLKRIINNFDLSKISHFTYKDREKFTSHPLGNTSFDPMGFGVAETELQFLISDGKLSFFYDGKTYQFGKDIDSESAEEIIDKIENFTNNDLRTTDDFENLRNQLS